MISKLSKITSLTNKYLQFQRINQNTIKRLFCNKNNENEKSEDSYKSKFFSNQNSQQQNKIDFNEKIKQYTQSFNNIFKNSSINQQQQNQKVNTEQQFINQEKEQQEEKVKSQEQEVNENKQEDNKNNDKIKQCSFREKLKEKSPKVSKVLEFGIHAWDLTFPNDKYKKKFIQNKERAKKQKEEELLKKEYTEEELAEMEKNVPEWKRGQLQLKEEIKQQQTIRQKLAANIKEKVNNTKTMQDFYKSEKYKDMQNIKQEYQQLKSDIKEHIDNSPSKTMQLTMGVVNLATQQSSTASAQNRMKEIDPDFNLWELEDEAKGIFLDAYNHYLQGELDYLENLCADSALGYFRVLLKKQEAEKSVPKYKQLWNVDKAYFYTATLPENNMPVFVFTVQCQEIYCMINKIDGKIIDGDDERLMSYEFQFAITPNFEIDVEKVGHNWQIIELQPRQITKMLV